MLGKIDIVIIITNANPVGFEAIFNFDYRLFRKTDFLVLLCFKKHSIIIPSRYQSCFQVGRGV